MNLQLLLCLRILCFGHPHCLRHVLHPQPAGVLGASDQRRHSGLVISVRPNLPRAELGVD